MDNETLSTLKTVCSAGRARESYNAEANERLNTLSDMGLLVVAYAPGLLSGRRREYRPTQQADEICEKMTIKAEDTEKAG